MSKFKIGDTVRIQKVFGTQVNSWYHTDSFNIIDIVSHYAVVDYYWGNDNKILIDKIELDIQTNRENALSKILEDDIS